MCRRRTRVANSPARVRSCRDRGRRRRSRGSGSQGAGRCSPSPRTARGSDAGARSAARRARRRRGKKNMPGPHPGAPANKAEDLKVPTGGPTGAEVGKDRRGEKRSKPADEEEGGSYGVAGRQRPREERGEDDRQCPPAGEPEG